MNEYVLLYLQYCSSYKTASEIIKSAHINLKIEELIYVEATLSF